MTSPTHAWLSSHHDTRLGASHRRRGAPCQDASGSIRFRDRNGRGELIQVLAVSDGHGGSRYDRSDVGSRLACEVALGAVLDVLRPSNGSLCSAAPLEEWRQWLAEALPRQLVSAWRQAVQTHAQTHARAHPRADSPESREESPSTVPYGATLGLLVLTPRWWGYTGLGDWDLVRLDAAGQAKLISEEPSEPARGEATYSLCMERAERHFLSRSGLVALDPQPEPFALLLSTDGIRKSCGSDADFLTLAQYLVSLPAPDPGAQTSELGQALDHISQQGSGDDVSAAIAHWQRRDNSQFSQPRVRKALLVQPLVQPPAVPLAASSDSARLPLGASAQPSGEPDCQAPRMGRGGGSSSRRASLWRQAVLAWLILAGTGLATAVVLGWGPFARRLGEGGALSPRALATLQETADALCHPTPPPPSAKGPQSWPADTAGSRGAADQATEQRSEPRGEPEPVQRHSPQPSGSGTAPPPRGDHSATRPASPSGESPDTAPDSPRAATGLRPAAGPLSLSPSQRDLQLPASQVAKREMTNRQTDALGSTHTARQPAATSAQGPAFPSTATETLDPDRLERIRGALNNRKATFQDLLRRAAPADAQPGKSTNRGPAANDGMGALIAWSHGEPGLGPPAAPSSPLSPPPAGSSRPEGTSLAWGWGLLSRLSLPGWISLPAPRPSGSPPAATRPRLCPELREALSWQWQRLTQETQLPRGGGRSESPQPLSRDRRVHPPAESEPRATPSDGLGQR